MEFNFEDPNHDPPQQTLRERRSAGSDCTSLAEVKVEEDVSRAFLPSSFDSAFEEETEASPTLSDPPSRTQSEAPSASGAHQSGSDGENAGAAKAKVFTRRKAGQASAGRQPGKDPLVVEYKDLVPLFKISQRQACTELGIGLSTMKRLCRKFGIKRWPGSLLSPADAFSWCTCTCVNHGGPAAPGGGIPTHQEGCPHRDQASPSRNSAGPSAPPAEETVLGEVVRSAGACAEESERGPVPSIVFAARDTCTSEQRESGEFTQDLFMTLELEAGALRISPLDEAEGVFATPNTAPPVWHSAMEGEWMADSFQTDAMNSEHGL
mmetsp:Transcript_13804/g.32787  ORF Transcript_13804/g.32787 Transcript_13804/m.32787 type:complete len:322 (+) Transcript_13804:137-1102(+)